MIYMVTYFNGKKWIDFVPFTAEEYAINFMNQMKAKYPDLDITVKAKFPSKFEAAAAVNTNIDIKF